MEKYDRHRLTIMTVLGIALFGSLYPLISAERNRKDVQSGYVIPRAFGVKTEDLDSDGKNEVIATYNGRDYLFMLDGNGRPVLRDYKINHSSSSSKLEILSETK